MCVLCYRLFEPDPAAFGSASEIDGCEKFLMDMLTRVVERKVYTYIMLIDMLTTTRFFLASELPIDLIKCILISQQLLADCRITC